MARKKQTGNISSGQVLFDQSSLAACFACFNAYPYVALAVSGGADSTALLLLVKHWIDTQSGHSPEITVLTVDHGLRPESAKEARWVGELSARMGFRHKTLVWSGEKPKSGIQASARKARYQLMTAYCRDHGIPALATAHHCDDQAETFLMRLQRGSGVDGLASISPRSRRNGVDLLRPLLSFTREPLRSFLKAEGQSWREDPSNKDESYERIRLRNALKAADDLGITPANLALSAKRLLRAREALERMTADFLKEHLVLDEAGFGSIPMTCLLAEAEDIGLRALIRLAAAFGGRKAVRLMKAENAYAKLRDGASGMTLAGCHFSVRGVTLTASREYGRMSKTPVSIEDNMLWDGRFTISPKSVEYAPDELALRPLGPDGIRLARTAGVALRKMPRAALLAAPSFWCGSELYHIPFAKDGGGLPNGPAPSPNITFANRDLLYSAAFSGISPS